MAAPAFPAFAVTFGVQYGPDERRETHPVLKKVSGDHYLVISAVDEAVAREFIVYLLGTAWSFMYPLEEFEWQRWAPKGRIATIEVARG
jgi:hypothetical protein